MDISHCVKSIYLKCTPLIFIIRELNLCRYKSKFSEKKKNILIFLWTTNGDSYLTKLLTPYTFVLTDIQTPASYWIDNLIESTCSWKLRIDGLLLQSLKTEFDMHEELEKKLFPVTWFCKYEKMEFNIWVLNIIPFWKVKNSFQINQKPLELWKDGI